MASSSLRPILPLVLVLCMATVFAIRAHSDQMAMYWGWHINNLAGAALKATCETNHFTHVSIAFLSNFGNGRPPRPDFGTSCDAESGGCRSLAEDIAACQRLGVKMLLSIGGFDVNNYTLVSAEEAHRLAAHIYDVYLSGYGIDGPLGKVKLDGIDFYVNDASTYDYWDVLAQDLKQLDGGMILTASQGCNHTAGKADMPLYRALKTGLFNKVWPRYHGHPCTYQPWDSAAFAVSVQNWATEFSEMDFYLGLIANPSYFEERWIHPNELLGALAEARQYRNYKGVMLWNRHWDVKFFEDGNGRAPYSDLIYPIIKASSTFAAF
ncbi:acidic endochitinase-like [Nymphaea colorata]|uniref:acidic endochitinase-like n=1 Tax=Nymphaea colorata TaxID=210225 RepID=UPI00129D8E97|nr:acidic endochitinase-like [Nymphaea colorata]